MIANDAEPRASPPAELVVEGIDKWFRTDRATSHAIEDVSFRATHRLRDLVVIGLPLGLLTSTSEYFLRTRSVTRSRSSRPCPAFVGFRLRCSGSASPRLPCCSWW
jgi:hypothetical protein